MYDIHQKWLLFTFIVVFIITNYLKIDFSVINSDCISIASYALAIYTISISSLIGNPLLKTLSKIQDNYLSTSTQLGILRNYYKYSISTSLLTIVVSCINKLNIHDSYLSILKSETIRDIALKEAIYHCISSMSLALFSLNFVFIIIILSFIIDKQLTS